MGIPRPGEMEFHTNPVPGESHDQSLYTKFVLISACYQFIKNRCKYLEANSINFVTFEN